MIHDITIPIHPKMLVWPKDPRPIFETIQTIAADGNQTSLIHLNSHTGTHIDAPKHFIKGGKSVDKINPEIFMGPAQVIEIPVKTAQITASHLESVTLSLSKGGPRVLFKTRNSRLRLLHKKSFYKNFVGFTADAADFLIKKGVKLVGADYLSCENPDWPAKTGKAWQVHKKLLAAGVVIIEGCDLSKIRAGSYQLIALPLKLQGLDGSPCRAVLWQS